MSTRTKYRVRAPWGAAVYVTADLARAEEAIRLVDDDGYQSATQYQTADARHEVGGLLRCVLAAMSEAWGYGLSADDGFEITEVQS